MVQYSVSEVLRKIKYTLIIQHNNEISVWFWKVGYIKSAWIRVGWTSKHKMVNYMLNFSTLQNIVNGWIQSMSFVFLLRIATYTLNRYCLKMLPHSVSIEMLNYFCCVNRRVQNRSLILHLCYDSHVFCQSKDQSLLYAWFYSVTIRLVRDQSIFISWR